MGKILRGSSLIYVYTLITVVFLDLSTKKLAEVYLSERSYEPLPFLKLFLIHNRGAAFGLFADLPDILRVPLLLITPLVALLITYLYSRRSEDPKMVFAMGLIAGGALGNLYDRLFLGEVRDFIHLHVGDLYWPAFNLADASITMAILFLLLHYIRK